MFDHGVGIKNPLFFIGVVENNDDPQLEGRIQVRAFSIHGDNTQIAAEDLPWAICAQAFGATMTPPPLNAFVYGMMLDGRDAQTPLILGMIPGQTVKGGLDQEKNGYGVIPHRNGNELSQGTAPRDVGQSNMPRLARGEYIHQTYVLGQEMGRSEGLKIGGTRDDDDKYKTWSEPSSAYNAQYPHNRVIETAHHSIELDDTPGSERIMIHHKSGSFVQIDSTGAHTQKTTGDRYDVTDGNLHQSTGDGGNHYVTIGGNAHVYVAGNKTEEIEGDYNLIVRGNAQFGSGGAMYLNAEMIEARGGDVKIEAKSTASLKAVKELFLGASGFTPGVPSLTGAPGPDGGDVKITGNKIYTTGYYSVESWSGLFTKLTSVIDTHMTGSNLFIGMTGAIPSFTPVPGLPIGTPPVNAPVITQGINILSGAKTNISTLGTLSLNTGLTSSINTVGAMSIKTGGVMDFSVGGAMNLLAGAALNATAVGELNLSGGGALNASAGGAMNLLAIGIANLDGSLVNIGAGAGAAAVAVPTFIPLDVPGVSLFGLPSLDAISVTMPEPPAKSTSLIPPSAGRSYNQAGYTGSSK